MKVFGTSRPLRVGQRVRINSGMLAGLEGIVIQCRASRLLLALKNNPDIFVEIEDFKLDPAVSRQRDPNLEKRLDPNWLPERLTKEWLVPGDPQCAHG